MPRRIGFGISGVSPGLIEAGHGASTPLVSIIVLNHNGLRFAEQCVRSVLGNDYPNFEVVVVDNGSADGSYEVLCTSFDRIPNIRIVRNAWNLGFAEGNNVGYLNSKGDVVVFLNVDTKVEPTWLSELVCSLSSSNRVGGAQSKLMSLRNTGQVDSVGPCMDQLGFVYLRTRCREPRREVEDLFYAEGACMAFKRKILEEVSLGKGPFDSDYFLYFEDSDLGWRVRLRGYRIIFVPSSVVYHYRGGSASTASQYVGAFSFAKNRVSTLIKNYSLGSLFRVLPLVVLLETARLTAFLPRQPVKSLAKLRALLWCLTNLRAIWKKRLYVQTRIRSIGDSEIRRHMVRPNFHAARRDSAILGAT